MTLCEYGIYSKLVLDVVQIIFYLVGLPWTLYSGYKLLRDKMDEGLYRKNQFRKALMDEWFCKFLTAEKMNESNAIAKFWTNSYWEWDVGACIRSIDTLNIHEIYDAAANGANQYSTLTGHKINFLKKASDIDESMWNKTSELLNQFEHLGKLFEADIVSKKDMDIFFYTIISDTFIACLPFIIYRRTVDEKPAYAHKFEYLTTKYPRLSNSWCRV